LLTLLKALICLKDLPWKWLLLGRGGLKEQLMTEANAAGVSDRLRFIDSVPHDEVPKYINIMHTLVLPSETTYQFKTLTSVGWKEQFGHVLIEAMACQVPVIGSDSGEIPHVIADAGLIFPEGNVEALQACLHQVMTQPELRIDLEKRAYARAIAHYTNQAIAQQQFEFYKTVLGDMALRA
jgi:L-malate glycosyltransferase